MKLSGKGFSKLGKVFQGCPLPPYILPRLLGCEFDPDDFEGDHFNHKDKMVVLTVEEAKRCHDCAQIALAFATERGERPTRELIENLLKRIEQAEEKCVSSF